MTHPLKTKRATFSHAWAGPCSGPSSGRRPACYRENRRNCANARMKDARKHLPACPAQPAMKQQHRTIRPLRAGHRPWQRQAKHRHSWSRDTAASNWYSALFSGYLRSQPVTGLPGLLTPRPGCFSNIFLMLGCAMCGLSQSLIAGFRLWQIRNRRVSPAEKAHFVISSLSQTGSARPQVSAKGNTDNATHHSNHYQ